MKKNVSGSIEFSKLFFVLGTAVVFAAKHHNSAQVTTIADIKANGWDEQRVLVDGEFTEHILQRFIYIY